jgi:pyruvate kinase
MAPPQLEQLVHAGVDLFRLNMAHGTRAEHAATIATIAELSHRVRPVAILVDLAGPKIRLGQLLDDPMECPHGAVRTFIRGRSALAPEQLVSNYERLIDELHVGDDVMLADGTVTLTVIEKHQDDVVCRVVNEGMIRSLQGINLPGARINLPSLTDHDLDCARWAAGQPVDFISLSFVRSAADVSTLKTLLRDAGCQAPVIAKIEKREALDQLDEIIDVADAAMVARGDLGVEIEVARIPEAQKRIVRVCNRKGKPVIVATQMLDSMQRSRRPTRAEVTDVANAILDGADACMLSAETAIGQYPVASVETMSRIMVAAEELLPDSAAPSHRRPGKAEPAITDSVVHGAAEIARDMGARLMVIVSRSGATALASSSRRQTTRCVGISDRDATLRQMCLMWGITPLPDAPCHDLPRLRQFINGWGRARGFLGTGDRVVVVTGSGLVPDAHNRVEVHEIA